MAIEVITVLDASAAIRKVLADLIGTDEYAQVLKMAFGVDGTLTLVEPTVGLPTAPVAGSTQDLGSVPAASRTTDTISAALATDKIVSNVTELTPKFAFANIAASTTDGSVVAAVASKKLRVLTFRLHTAGVATNVTFNSKPAGAGTAISELFACGVNGGRGEGFTPTGHFETVSGEGLTVTTGAGSTTGIGVSYVEV